MNRRRVPSIALAHWLESTWRRNWWKSRRRKDRNFVDRNAPRRRTWCRQLNRPRPPNSSFPHCFEPNQQPPRIANIQNSRRRAIATILLYFHTTYKCRNIIPRPPARPKSRRHCDGKYIPGQWREEPSCWDHGRLREKAPASRTRSPAAAGLRETDSARKLAKPLESIELAPVFPWPQFRRRATSSELGMSVS